MINYCRANTVKCDPPQNCCRHHIKEMKSYLYELLDQYNIEYVDTDDSFIIDSRDHSKLMYIANKVNRDENGYYFVVNDVDNKTSAMYYSRINHTHVNFRFNLNLGSYLVSDQNITNHRIVSWGYDALLKLVEAYENGVNSLLKPDSTEVYDDIAYNINWFIHHLQNASDILKFHLQPYQDKFSFIDIGCGLGSKVKIASRLFDAYGIEYHEPYVEQARMLLDNTVRFNYGNFKKKKKKEEKVERIIHGDALEFDDYGLFDVIYFFNPIKNFKSEVKLEKLIYEQAKEGAVIIPIWNQSRFPKEIRRTKLKNIFVKLTDEDRFRALEKWIAETWTYPAKA